MYIEERTITRRRAPCTPDKSPRVPATVADKLCGRRANMAALPRPPLRETRRDTPGERERSAYCVARVRESGARRSRSIPTGHALSPSTVNASPASGSSSRSLRPASRTLTSTKPSSIALGTGPSVCAPALAAGVTSRPTMWSMSIPRERGYPLLSWPRISTASDEQLGQVGGGASSSSGLKWVSPRCPHA